jgi:hypothetical protein
MFDVPRHLNHHFLLKVEKQLSFRNPQINVSDFFRSVSLHEDENDSESREEDPQGLLARRDENGENITCHSKDDLPSAMLEEYEVSANFRSKRRCTLPKQEHSSLDATHFQKTDTADRSELQFEEEYEPPRFGLMKSSLMLRDDA